MTKDGIKFNFATKMSGQRGEYLVKFKTRTKQKKYVEIAKTHYPYFYIVEQDFKDLK